MRESPALDIIHLLQKRGATVTYSDPFVPKIRVDGIDLTSQDLVNSATNADCVVVVTDHSGIDYGDDREAEQAHTRHTTRTERHQFAKRDPALNTDHASAASSAVSMPIWESR